MTIPSWPSTLPSRPQRTSYQEQIPGMSQVVTTGNKSLLVRRNSTRAQEKLSVVYVLSSDQVEYLKMFYNDTLAAGTLRFNYTHPVTGKVIEVSFDPSSENGLTITPFEKTLHWQVSMTFIIWS